MLNRVKHSTSARTRHTAQAAPHPRTVLGPQRPTMLATQVDSTTDVADCHVSSGASWRALLEWSIPPSFSIFFHLPQAARHGVRAMRDSSSAARACRSSRRGRAPSSGEPKLVKLVKLGKLVKARRAARTCCARARRVTTPPQGAGRRA